MVELSRRSFALAGSASAIALLAGCATVQQLTLADLQGAANELVAGIGAALPAFLPSMSDADKAKANASFAAMAAAAKALGDVKATATDWIAVAKDVLAGLVTAARVLLPLIALPASIAGPVGIIISALAAFLGGTMTASAAFQPHPELHPVAVRLTLERAGYHFAPIPRP